MQLGLGYNNGSYILSIRKPPAKMSYQNYNNRGRYRGPYNQQNSGTQPPTQPTRQPQISQKAKPVFDLNTDFAQVEDSQLFHDLENSLFPIVTSLNIPCCVHEGNPKEILEAICLARKHQKVVGAHIAYPDPRNRGYQSLQISPDELRAWILVQLGALKALCQAVPMDLLHVRPHGALYADMAKDPGIAKIVIQTIKQFDPWMILIMPICDHAEKLEKEIGLQIHQELYIGKRFATSGVQMLDRTSISANLPPQGALEQVRRLIQRGQVTAEDGRTFNVNCKTLHISPKFPDSVFLAKQITQLLQNPAAVTLNAAEQSGWLDFSDIARELV